MARKKEVQLQDPGAKPRVEGLAEPDGRDGLWFVVQRDIERDGVHYFSVNHHLVLAGQVPDRVPSMGAKTKDGTVKTDKSGMINLAGAASSDVWALCSNGTVRPVRMTKKLEKILRDGQTLTTTAAVQLIPPMRKVTNLSQHYQQMTGAELPKNGGANEGFYSGVLGKFPVGVPFGGQR